MQVDPIKPASKATGTKRLKLRYDELLSNVAFKFNLRRCTEETSLLPQLALLQPITPLLKVGRCRLTLSNPR